MLQYISDINNYVSYTGYTISLASLGYGIICSLYDPVEGAGYIANAASSALCTYCYKELTLRRSIAKSAENLKRSVEALKRSEATLKNSEENLKLHNLNMQHKIVFLESNINDFQVSNKRLEDDIEMLKATVGIVGQKGDLLIEQLRIVHDNIKEENIRQRALIKRQTCLHVCQLMQHLDENNDAFLDEKELDAARSYLNMMIPNLNINNLENAMINGRLDLNGLLDSLQL